MNLTKKIGCILLLAVTTTGFTMDKHEKIEKVRQSRHDEKILSELLPIVRCSFKPSKYEALLMTELRDAETSTKQFRFVSDKLAEMLVSKVMECLPTSAIEVATPVTRCAGESLSSKVELVSVMRSGDALLDTFIKHFPDASISKFLVQRNEKTAKPHFKFKKISSTLSSGNYVIITEPMIATGGSLDMVISLLKEQGVQEDRIIIASICAAPEGLVELSAKYPGIQVVMTVLDEKLNEKKYIVPGLGDFGDRYFGTEEPKIG